MAREPLLTYMMPAYAGASFLGWYLYGNTGKYLFPTSAFGAIWAGINIARTKQFDLGLITMGIVAVTSGMEAHNSPEEPHHILQSAQTLGCMAVAMNFALPILFWDEVGKLLARRKSEYWVKVFYYYCVSMNIYWWTAAFMNQGWEFQFADSD